MSILNMLMTPEQLDSLLDNTHLQSIIEQQQAQLNLLAETVLEAHISEIYTENEDGHNNKAKLKFRDCQCPACQLARKIMEAGNEHT